MIDELRPYPEYKDSGLPWLGKLPGHWRTRRTKAIVSNVVEQTTKMNRDDVYLALEHVESWTGRTRPVVGDQPFAGQVKRFEMDDVLFGKLRPYLAKVAYAATHGVCAGEFFVLRPRGSETISRYLEHLLRSKPVIDVINGSTFGAKMPRADWQFLGNLAISLPPPDEQAAIVRFLDHANSKIERAIRAKKKLIALLNEQKQAIIHRAVTCGLDPNVKLKPSGIAWLGDVPEHWQVWRINRLARVGNGSTPSRAKPIFWSGGTYPWLNSSQVHRGFIDSADQFVTETALRECHLPRVPAGSLLVAITGQGKTRGTAAILGFEATINQHIAYITPRMAIVSPEFLHLAFIAAYPTLRAISDDSGSTKGALTCRAYAQ